jgi:hypothetical protein
VIPFLHLISRWDDGLLRAHMCEGVKHIYTSPGVDPTTIDEHTTWRVGLEALRKLEKLSPGGLMPIDFTTDPKLFGRTIYVDDSVPPNDIYLQVDGQTVVCVSCLD